MKKLFTFLATVLLTANVFAQSPKLINYQVVISNISNALITNQRVGMRISIQRIEFRVPPLPPLYTDVYVETHLPTTNAKGLASIIIGEGTVEGGTFETIDWADGPYYIYTEVDPAGGTNYTITGINQLLSAP